MTTNKSIRFDPQLSGATITRLRACRAGEMERAGRAESRQEKEERRKMYVGLGLAVLILLFLSAWAVVFTNYFEFKSF